MTRTGQKDVFKIGTHRGGGEGRRSSAQLKVGDELALARIHLRAHRRTCRRGIRSPPLSTLASASSPSSAPASAAAPSPHSRPFLAKSASRVLPTRTRTTRREVTCRQQHVAQEMLHGGRVGGSRGKVLRVRVQRAPTLCSHVTPHGASRELRAESVDLPTDGRTEQNRTGQDRTGRDATDTPCSGLSQDLS